MGIHIIGLIYGAPPRNKEEPSSLACVECGLCCYYYYYLRGEVSRPRTMGWRETDIQRQRRISYERFVNGGVLSHYNV